MKYSGNHKRLLAAMIDNFIISLLFYIPLFLPLFFIQNPDNITNVFFLLFCSFFIFYYLLLYFIFFGIIPSKYNGQSIGKRIMEIKIIDYNGKNPSIIIHLLRQLIMFIGANIVSIFYFITILITDRKQGIHDMLLKTYVVEDE